MLWCCSTNQDAQVYARHRKVNCDREQVDALEGNMANGFPSAESERTRSSYNRLDEITSNPT